MWYVLQHRIFFMTRRSKTAASAVTARHISTVASLRKRRRRHDDVICTLNCHFNIAVLDHCCCSDSWCLATFLSLLSPFAACTKYTRSDDPKMNSRMTIMLFSDLVSEDTMAEIESAKEANVGRLSQTFGPILPATKSLLDDFYRPFNRRLAQLLGDDRFLWEDY
ncbi:hypothetical protein BaRGS_00003820 [Batillaria attramentaria]|uniref:Uncharacterized protein n=1 Tax=Batillaria attramentaria TaxID=370345 RepID=A0ABD0M0N5_9CAEN